MVAFFQTEEDSKKIWQKEISSCDSDSSEINHSTVASKQKLAFIFNLSVAARVFGMAGTTETFN